MIKRRYSSELSSEMDGKVVTVAGWVHEKRKMGKLIFLLIRDRNGIVQLTLPGKFVPKEVFETARNVSKESVVVARGKLQKMEKAPGGFEIIPEEIKVLARAESPLPLDPTGKVPANLDTRLDSRVIDLRKPEIMAVFKIRSNMLKAAREYLYRKSFLEIHSPRIISTASEGGTELFPIAYFEKEAFLAQSPQLYKQMLMGTGMDAVFEVATYFRAEEHDTIWHLNEITAIDCEMAFIEDEEDILTLIENLIVAMVREVKENCQKEIELLGRDISIPEKPFPRIEYSKAIELLEEAGLRLPFGEDLTTETEKRLGEIMKEKGHVFYFVTKYPLGIKPFYTMPENSEQKLSRAFDLEFSGREIISGSQRIHNYDLLVDRIKAKGLRPESFGAYLKAFKYGMPPHGGFGMGIERLLMLLLNLSNIREAVLFPRDRYRLKP
ncbi:MAG TPA: aspartate--tRNA(Asn) ligase [Euryarchaeota archaeon]|nr:asparagine--tRNA ligase [archaeon BMS3Bbin15]HDL15459.1 aspartate--tRNA(Asn) ligase [Euryarchaeota archaeon]